MCRTNCFIIYGQVWSDMITHDNTLYHHRWSYMFIYDHIRSHIITDHVWSCMVIDDHIRSYDHHVIIYDNISSNMHMSCAVEPHQSKWKTQEHTRTEKHRKTREHTEPHSNRAMAARASWDHSGQGGSTYLILMRQVRIPKMVPSLIWEIVKLACVWSHMISHDHT